jgi:hypothetical protein
MADIPVFTLGRILHSVWKGLVFVIKDRYGALRQVQSYKWWGLCWDFRGFLGMFAEGNGPVYVTCLQGFGINKSKSAILKISGYVQSNVTGKQLPLTMEGMHPEETNGIPANCRFFIQALFRDPTSPREGIVKEKFLEEWRDFTFFFIADGKPQKYHFSSKEIIGRINEFSRPLKKLPAPVITKKT